MTDSSRSRRPEWTIRAALLAIFMLVAGCGGSTSSSEAAQSAPSEQQVDASAETSPDVLPEAFSPENDDRSVAQKIKDASLAAEVQLALVEDNELRAFEFTPLVMNERVLLRGSVQTLDQRRKAAQIASDVQGIRAVVNEVASTEQPEIASADSLSGPSPDTSSALAEEAQPDASGENEGARASENAADANEEEADAREDQATYHTVRSGDNLWDIARSYSVTVDQIKRLNDMGSNAIKPGDRLRVK